MKNVQNLDKVNNINLLKAIKIDPSWMEFLKQENVLIELMKIDKTISATNFTPNLDLVLRFFELNIKDIKVLILGRDVYPQKAVATGRSFEVRGINSWQDKSINSSLKNILKLIYKAYIQSSDKVNIEKIRNEIKDGSFKILPPDKVFDDWEKQGVMFLNAGFTCEVGKFEKSGSHIKIWKQFFTLLLNYIASQNSEIKYFLWGDSKKYSKNLEILGVSPLNIYTSKHPCTNGENDKYENGKNFLNCPCFLETKNIIKWVNQ